MPEAQSLPPMRPMLAESPSEFVLMERAVEDEYRPGMLQEIQRRVQKLAKTVRTEPRVAQRGLILLALLMYLAQGRSLSAQTIATFKYAGAPFDVAYCNSLLFAHGTCVSGSMSATATFNLSSSFGFVGPTSFTASALGLTYTSTNFYNATFQHESGVLVGY